MITVVFYLADGSRRWSCCKAELWSWTASAEARTVLEGSFLMNKQGLSLNGHFVRAAFLTHASSVFVALAAFGLRALLVDEPLTAPDVFAGLALFNQLTVPLFIFPVTVPIAISAMVSVRSPNPHPTNMKSNGNVLDVQVSMRRLEGFLDQPELSRVLPPKIESARPRCAPPSMHTIRISGEFSWGATVSSAPAALCVDNVSIPQGLFRIILIRET